MGFSSCFQHFSAWLIQVKVAKFWKHFFQQDQREKRQTGFNWIVSPKSREFLSPVSINGVTMMSFKHFFCACQQHLRKMRARENKQSVFFLLALKKKKRINKNLLIKFCILFLSWCFSHVWNKKYTNIKSILNIFQVDIQIMFYVFGIFRFSVKYWVSLIKSKRVTLVE